MKKIIKYSMHARFSKVIAWYAAFLLFACTTVLGQQIKVLPNNGEPSQQTGPQAAAKYQRVFYLIRPSEMQASGFPAGTAPTSLGFTLAIPQADTARGAFKIYLQNTEDITSRADTGWISIPVSTNTYNLQGLFPSTYEWQVKATCDDTNSNYSPSAIFSNNGLAPCNAPSSLSVSDLTSDTATLRWEAPASLVTKYVIGYKLNDDVEYTYDSTESNFFGLSGLTADTLYQWLVYTRCATDSSDIKYGSFYTEELSSCNAPTSLVAGSLTETSVNLTWTLAAEATYYNVRFRRSGIVNWSSAIVFTNNVTIDTGLVAGTTYEWQVQAICATGKGSFVNGTSFSTTGPLACYPPDFLSTDNITDSSAQFKWTATNGASGYTLRFRSREIVTWETAINGMTLVHNDSIIIPNTIGRVEIPFESGDAFEYTGNGLYVAFEYSNEDGPYTELNRYLSTRSDFSIKDSQGLDSVKLYQAFGSRIDSSLTKQDSVLVALNMRPETFLGAADLADSIAVEAIYALGNIIPGIQNTVEALVANLGVEPMDVDVQLKAISVLGGIQRFAETQSINIPAGDTQRVSFNVPQGAAGSSDSLVIFVPAIGAEVVTSNNTAFYIQTYNVSRLGYDDNSAAFTGGGSDTLDGLTLIKLALKDCSEVTAIQAYLNEDAGGQSLYASILDKDGTVLATSDTLVIGANEVDRYHTFILSQPVAASADSFYVGIGQIASVNLVNPVGVQWEGLVRDGAYYRSKADGDSMTEQKVPGRLMINVQLVPGGENVFIDGNVALCGGDPVTLTAGSITTRYANSVVSASSQYSATLFGSNQLLGAPDVYPGYGLNANAWVASTSDNGSGEALVLKFPGAAPINFVDIYETNNPGAVTAILVKNPDTDVFEVVYSGAAIVAAPQARRNRITFDTTTFNVSEIKIVLNTKAVPGFNAIDAVGIGTLGTPAGFVDYLWQPGGETTESIVVNTAGTYRVTATLTNGCKVTDSIEVKVPVTTTPVVTALGPTTICAGDSVTLTSSQEFGNTWSTGEITKSIVVKSAGSYTVSFDDGTGCGAITSSAVAVALNAAPTLTGITGELAVCAGGSTTLTLPGGFTSYQWSNGLPNASIEVTTPGVYWGRVTNAQGCSAADTVVVVTGAGLTPSITGVTAICGSQSTTLDAGDYAQYAWSTGASTRTIQAGLAGIYSVTVTDNKGCSGTATTTVTELPAAMVSITGILEICQGGGTKLTASSSASYSWSTGQTGNEITVTTPGIYSVTILNADGCEANASVQVSQNPNPVPQIAGAGGFCPGGSTLLTAQAGYVQYAWSTGTNTAAISVSAAETYTVTVTDANGCEGSNSKTIVENPTPQPVIAGTLSFCGGGATTLSASNEYVGYLWSTNAESATSNSITVTEVDTYEVTVTDVNGCTGSASATTTLSEALPVPPGPISGPTLKLCNTTGNLYKIDPVPNTSFYLWTLPEGASFADNDTTGTSLLVNFGSDFEGGKIIVAANNTCGQSANIKPTFIAVAAGTAPPTAIVGRTSGICGPVSFNYSVAAVAGATAYNWVAPANATIVSGQGTNSISLAFSAAFTSGSLCVSVASACGTSDAYCTFIQKALPATGPITGPTIVCNNQVNVTYSIVPVEGATSYFWSVPTSVKLMSGQGTASIVVSFKTKEARIRVTPKSACGDGVTSTISVVTRKCPTGTLGVEEDTRTLESKRLMPEIIANDGGQQNKGDIQLDWTLGEPVIEIAKGNNRMITQGFHQPLLMLGKKPSDSLITLHKGLRIIAAPNPVTSNLMVHFYAEKEMDLWLQLTSAAGQVMQARPVKAWVNSIEVKMGSYISGIYMLTLRDRSGKVISSTKILKL